jgi:hypothetical protein
LLQQESKNSQPREGAEKQLVCWDPRESELVSDEEVELRERRRRGSCEGERRKKSAARAVDRSGRVAGWVTRRRP